MSEGWAKAICNGKLAGVSSRVHTDLFGIPVLCMLSWTRKDCRDALETVRSPGVHTFTYQWGVG